MATFAMFDPIAALVELFSSMFRRHHKRGRR